MARTRPELASSFDDQARARQRLVAIDAARLSLSGKAFPSRVFVILAHPANIN